MSFIIKAVSTSPANLVKQADINALLKKMWPAKASLIDQFSASTEVATRYLSLPLEAYVDLGDMGKRNTHWKNTAINLQKENLRRLLLESNIDISDVALLASATTTGLAVPSLEALMMNQFPFLPNTKRLPLFGLGCLAGVAGMDRVNDFLEGNPKSAAILMVTELCSLTFQFKDDSIANLIGSSLFGDGSAAVMLVGREHPLALESVFEIVATESIFYKNTERIMGWDMVENGFQIVLSNDIPKLVKEEVGKNIDDFLKKNKLLRNNIDFFIAHPGGPKVLDALTETLGRKREDFYLSWQSLKERGNTSAASVLNILENTMKRSDIKKNSLGLMMAMGPAFSLELCLVRKC